jgi:thiosulfate reductase / polysulfide reductase chain A
VKNLLGYGRDAVKYDFKNTQHIVLYGRNIVEAIMVKEVKAVTEGLANGAKLTYIDPRASVTAGKATRYWRIKPGTDYALNLAIANTIIREDLYDKDFVANWATGFAELAEFVRPYTPQWAEQETEIPADEIIAFCREVAKDAPHVIFHGGWMNSRYPDSFYASRMAMVINVLLGSIEVKGGLFFAKGPGAAGRKGLKALVDLMPKPADPRCDGVGTTIKHIDAGAGLMQLLYPCIETGNPYPVKAYFAYRHDPLLANPDPDEQKRIFEHLDLLVAIDVNYSETAWHADVLLPECTFLERDNILQSTSGLKPALYRRQKAVEPRYDTKPMWWIVKELLKRLGKADLFPFDTMEDIWAYQLKDTGVAIADFDAKGFVSLAADPIWMDRQTGLKFPTPSGKIEIVSSVMEQAGLPSFAPYQKPSTGPDGSFRLLVGRCGFQAHGQSINNPALNEILGENVLWINSGEASKRGIKNGDWVEVSNDAARGRIKAFVTDFIHPDAVFMLHGYGRTVPAQTRAHNKGLADQIFEKGLLLNYDKAGGGANLLECFVNVQRAA